MHVCGKLIVFTDNLSNLQYDQAIKILRQTFLDVLLMPLAETIKEFGSFMF